MRHNSTQRDANHSDVNVRDDVPPSRYSYTSRRNEPRSTNQSSATRARFMHVKTQESQNNEGKYKVFHQVHITADREGNQPTNGIASVAYHTPNQGFRHDTRERFAEPFEIRYGPCWGRPHVTVDIRIHGSSEVMHAVFEGNLPSTDSTIQLYHAPSAAEPTTSSTLANPGALGHTLEPDQVPTHLVCSVSCEVFQDPVVCMDGHTYDRSSIERWFLDHDTSPMTNMKLPTKVLIPNLALRAELSQLAGL